MRTIRLAALTTTTIALLAATACGGSSNTPTAAPTAAEQTTVEAGKMTHSEAGKIADELNTFRTKYSAEMATMRAFPADPNNPPKPTPFDPDGNVTADQVLKTDVDYWTAHRIDSETAGTIIVYMGPMFAQHGHDAVSFIGDGNMISDHALAALAS